MNERVMFEGMRAEKRRSLRDLVTRANGLVSAIHIQTHPFLKVEELRVDQIASQARDLEKHVYKIRALMDEIAALNRELGEDEDG